MQTGSRGDTSSTWRIERWHKGAQGPRKHKHKVAAHLAAVGGGSTHRRHGSKWACTGAPQRSGGPRCMVATPGAAHMARLTGTVQPPRGNGDKGQKCYLQALLRAGKAPVGTLYQCEAARGVGVARRRLRASAGLFMLLVITATRLHCLGRPYFQPRPVLTDLTPRWP